MREYRYDRSRYGIIGTVDYKVSEGSDIAARFLYSDFKDYGDRWDYNLQNGDVPSFGVSRRLPDYAIGTLAISGKQLLTNSWLTYEVSAARARQAAAAGNPGANFRQQVSSAIQPGVYRTWQPGFRSDAVHAE
jgi:hypothetical protein